MSNENKSDKWAKKIQLHHELGISAGFYSDVEEGQHIPGIYKETLSTRLCEEFEFTQHIDLNARPGPTGDWISRAEPNLTYKIWFKSYEIGMEDRSKRTLQIFLNNIYKLTDPGDYWTKCQI